MPQVSGSEISELIAPKSGSSALLLGYAYKADLGDTRETPVEYLADNLISRGIKPIVWDPVVPSEKIPDRFEKISSLDQCPPVDIVVLSTAHRQILDIDWANLKHISGCSTIYDGRRALDKIEISEFGWEYHGVGLPVA